MDKTEFGKRLRYLRAEAGYTQEKLAELSNMSTVYLGEIERGKKVVGLDKFIKLVRALDVSADYILCNELPSGAPYVFDEITERLKDLDPKQLKTALDILDAYLKNL